MGSRKEKAKKHFLGQEGHEKLNCAEAIFKAYYDLFDAPQQEIKAFAAFGGGKAPEGRCGAYHAALHLIAKKYSDKLHRLEEEFLAAAGSLKCKEIRKLRKLTCLGSIEKAAALLEEFRNTP